MELTVVHHFHVVTCTRLSHPVAARLGSDLSGCCLEDGLDGWPSSNRPSRHERRAVTSTFLTTRDTRSYEEKALFLQCFRPTDGVLIIRVTAVNDDITFLEVRLELLDEIIDGFACLYEEDNLSWRLELSTKLLDRESPNDFGA